GGPGLLVVLEFEPQIRKLLRFPVHGMAENHYMGEAHSPQSLDMLICRDRAAKGQAPIYEEYSHD
ncbi:MAG: hypothetical protein Q8P12_07230, partial [bacterium]|nr:hypothetical protein [bacterium]